MTAEEHAKIWLQAASVVSGMDPRRPQQSKMQEYGVMVLTYSAEHAALWDGFNGAATVLRQIGTAYEAAAKAENTIET